MSRITKSRAGALTIGLGVLLPLCGSQSQAGGVREGLRATARHAGSEAWAELGAARGKYEAWRRAVLDGDSFFTTGDDALSRLYRQARNTCDKAVLEDRLSDAKGAEFLDELIALGEEAKQLRGGADRLSAGQSRELAMELFILDERMQDAMKVVVDPAAATPTLNRIQVSTSELVRYGASTGELSKGQLASVRRKTAKLEEDESRAKEDQVVSDRERENLIEDAREISRDVLEILRR